MMTSVLDDRQLQGVRSRTADRAMQYAHTVLAVHYVNPWDEWCIPDDGRGERDIIMLGDALEQSAHDMAADIARDPWEIAQVLANMALVYMFGQALSPEGFAAAYERGTA